MKINGLVAMMLLSSTIALAQVDINNDSIKQVNLKEIVISSTRATEETPMTFSEITDIQIEKNNLGKDMPYLLEMTPSVVTTSDAGAGVGYTGIRVRGSDASRVNITINGIPYNDSESQGTFWVNMPDFASSVSSIQIQRGVGTSTNGAGAFGASVNIETSGLNKEAYTTLDNTFGSFNTRKHTLMMGTGLINNKFSFDARLSKIASDGYLDRASSNLTSYYLSGTYYGEHSLIKLNVFSGHEITYQSWEGTPVSRINNSVEEMNQYASRNYLGDSDIDNLINSGRTYNYYTYDNQVDDYKQNHYQLISSFDLNQLLTLNVALHYTHGEGYYEQFKAGQDLSDYNLSKVIIGSDTISSTDLVRRKWLNNDFYGTTFSLDYVPNSKLNIKLGGALNQYDGDHFGEVIWAKYASNGQIRQRYYNNNGLKTDFNIFTKANWLITENLSLYGDLQYRHLDYTLDGFSDINQSETYSYDFFNPKIGLNYFINDNSNIYLSGAVGNKEPSRSDFTDHPSTSTPKHETLYNFELGFKKAESSYHLGVNSYLMLYDNQLVLTGALNDVGTPLRQNVNDSYRMGIEFQGSVHFFNMLTFNLNVAYSKNIIQNFEEVIYNYGEAWENDPAVAEIITYHNTNIAYSPNLILSGSIDFHPAKNLNLSLIGKYVGKQYLDNTSAISRSLKEYLVSDFVANYSLSQLGLKSLGFKLGVYNILNTLYSSNGYTWGYRVGGDEIREVFHYPQAGLNYMVGLTIKL